MGEVLLIILGILLFFVMLYLVITEDYVRIIKFISKKFKKPKHKPKPDWVEAYDTLSRIRQFVENNSFEYASKSVKILLEQVEWLCNTACTYVHFNGQSHREAFRQILISYAETLRIVENSLEEAIFHQMHENDQLYTNIYDLLEYLVAEWKPLIKIVKTNQDLSRRMKENEILSSLTKEKEILEKLKELREGVI
ncbi:hypothetical protein [Psychrobacillus sp. FSL H8-0510]|uniref:hypothetical protein n=1 Tax=Psychrobacillus sp. FSL H8-0510 TaxID=2921394 RepID=UPI0030F7EDD9